MSLFQRPVEKNKPQYLHAESSANCCGVTWFTHFPEPRLIYPVTKDGIPDYKQPPEFGVKKEVLEQIKVDIKLLDKKRNSVQLIALTDKQKVHYGQMLKDLGYRPLLADAYHTYAGNLLTIYGKRRYKKDKGGQYIDTCTGEGPVEPEYLENDSDDLEDLDEDF